MQNESAIHALLVEDDVRLADLTREYLEKQDLVVSVVHDGDQGLSHALGGGFNVLLLDVMLPGRTGIEICQKVREHSDVPIIMLTARGEEADRVMGLEIGADDYMPKPFSLRELLARIRAVVRRARGQSGPRSKAIVRGALTLDPGTRQVRLAGRLINLTGYEFSLLHALVERAGRVLSREQLMELAGGSAEEAFDRSVDVHISRLRQKLGEDKKGPKLIKTIRGIGYQFVTEEENERGNS